MAGEQLFEFDCDLCAYVLGNIRQHLVGLSERPTPVPFVHPADWNLLGFADWFARQFTRYMPGLGDHVWAGVFGEAPRLPLNDAELDALKLVMDDPPVRLEPLCIWVPYPELHAQAVHVIPEIRDALTRQTAEEWAEASAGYAARLREDGLTTSRGIATVQEWLWHVRRLLQAIGATEYLPAPAGTHPTPTTPSPDRVVAGRTRRVRRAILSADTGADTQPQPEMLSPARITKRFDVSRSTVYAACRSGQLPHYRVPARKGARGKYLLREADVAAWLESLRVGPGSPTPSASASAPASSGSRGGLFSVLNPARLAKAWK